MAGKNQMDPGLQISVLVHRSTPVDFPKDPESVDSEEQLSPLTLGL